MAAPHPGAQVEEVRGRNPRLREATDQQQLPQMPGICPVGLRAILVALQAAPLRGLGEVGLRANPLKLLDQEPPARRRLQRGLEIGALEPRQELPYADAVGRRDPSSPI
jgi:hypothetical protein